MYIMTAIVNTSQAARLTGRDLSLRADLICLMMSFVTASLAARREVDSDFWRATTA